MPYINIPGSVGPLEVCYTIATPSSPNAQTIIRKLPTIIFLHSGYVGQIVFQAQFSDPNLRRFNLVSLDFRGFGETRGVIGDNKYTPTETAEDVFQFMNVLQLPACHFFALSLGSAVALELASTHPDRVLSMTLCSPLTPEEPEEIKAGRLEVYDLWHNGVLATPENEEPDEELVNEVVIGATQLLFNNMSSHLISALIKCGLNQAMGLWSGTEEKVKESYRTAISWFVDRKALTKNDLAKIKCPVSVVHCFDDLGYPLENAENLVKNLQDAGVPKAKLFTVAGSHYGNVMGAVAINPILQDTVLSSIGSNPPPPLVSPDPDVQRMRTPFDDLLEKFGYNPLYNSDSD